MSLGPSNNFEGIPLRFPLKPPKRGHPQKKTNPNVVVVGTC